MEWLIQLTSALSPWIGIFSVGVFALIPIVYFLSAAKTPIKRVPVICPETGDPLRVRMKINIFRTARKIGGGIDVAHCPRFSREEGICSKQCLLESRPQQIHRRALERHVKKTAIVVS